MAKIVLLSCTKSKLDKPAPAKDMYSPSPMFQKTKVYGEALKPDKMFILSAKYGLLPMDKQIEPYDLTLKTMKKEEKDQWGETVKSQMSKMGVNPQSDKFVFLTGAEYMKPLEGFIPAKNKEKPMEGKRMGERLSWLNSQAQKLKEIVKKINNLEKEIYKVAKKEFNIGSTKQLGEVMYNEMKISSLKKTKKGRDIKT